MSTKYHLFIDGQIVKNATRARKDAVIKIGDAAHLPYEVRTDTGKVVHQVDFGVEFTDLGETPVEEPIEPQADESAETTDEDVEQEEPIEPQADESAETTDEDVEQEETAEESVPLTEGGTKFDVKSLKRKIAALLAKAERTDSEPEREALVAKAEKMMLRLGINQAELEAAGEVKPEEIVEVVREWHGNYSIAMVPFVHDVALGFGNLTILQSKNFNGMTRRTFIIGHKSDVEAFCTLIDSLALQVMTALRRWQKENIESRRHLTDMEKYVQHRSFILGFGKTVSNRLFQMRQTEEKQASTGAALVLASKMDRVVEWQGQKYGNLKNARGGMQYHSSIAMGAGRVAGQSANLGGKSVGGKKGELQ